jgi:hypothetical protein
MIGVIRLVHNENFHDKSDIQVSQSYGWCPLFLPPNNIPLIKLFLWMNSFF